MIQRLSPEGVPVPNRPYSPAVRAGDFLFVSGQGPVDVTTDQMSYGDIQHETLSRAGKHQEDSGRLRSKSK